TPKGAREVWWPVKSLAPLFWCGEFGTLLLLQHQKNHQSHHLSPETAHTALPLNFRSSMKTTLSHSDGSFPYHCTPWLNTNQPPGPLSVVTMVWDLLISSIPSWHPMASSMTTKTPASTSTVLGNSSSDQCGPAQLSIPQIMCGLSNFPSTRGFMWCTRPLADFTHLAVQSLLQQLHWQQQHHGLCGSLVGNSAQGYKPVETSLFLFPYGHCPVPLVHMSHRCPSRLSGSLVPGSPHSEQKEAIYRRAQQWKATIEIKQVPLPGQDNTHPKRSRLLTSPNYPGQRILRQLSTRQYPLP
ncbi:Zinc finger MIZ domain-containing protein 1, partial [Galemys pyrenaicus]